MIQSETRTIGGDEYEVTQLPSGRGRKLLLRLLRIVGPAIAELVKDGTSSVKLSDVSADGLAAALQELAARLTEDDFEYAVRELTSGTKVRIAGGPAVKLETVSELHFAGNYGAMLSWLGFALEVNFRSFFGGLGSLVPPGLAEKARSASPSPTE
jgi:hypothetical protein